MTILSAQDAGPALQAALADLDHGPVMVEQNDRTIAVLVSAAEYRRAMAALLNAQCDEIGAHAASAGLTEAIFADLMSDVS